MLVLDAHISKKKKKPFGKLPFSHVLYVGRQLDKERERDSILHLLDRWAI